VGGRKRKRLEKCNLWESVFTSSGNRFPCTANPFPIHHHPARSHARTRDELPNFLACRKETYTMGKQINGRGKKRKRRERESCSRRTMERRTFMTTAASRGIFRVTPSAGCDAAAGVGALLAIFLSAVRLPVRWVLRL
jgi:hypothetical protein